MAMGLLHCESSPFSPCYSLTPFHFLSLILDNMLMLNLQCGKYNTFAAGNIFKEDEPCQDKNCTHKGCQSECQDVETLVARTVTQKQIWKKEKVKTKHR